MRKILVLIFIVCGIGNLYAQQAVLPAGGQVQGSDGCVSFSIGQIAVESGEGVQIPFEIYALNLSVDDIQLNVAAYPNPTSSMLILDLALSDYSQCSYRLYDANGKLVLSNKIEGSRTEIDMSKLVAGIYFLQVLNGERQLAYYKIVKK